MRLYDIPRAAFAALCVDAALAKITSPVVYESGPNAAAGLDEFVTYRAVSGLALASKDGSKGAGKGALEVCAVSSDYDRALELADRACRALEACADPQFILTEHEEEFDAQRAAFVEVLTFSALY